MQQRKIAVIFISLFFLFSFALLSKLEDRALLRGFDFAVTVRVQDAVAKVCTSRCDGVIEDIGFFASPLFSVFAVGALMMLNRKRGLRVLAIPVLFALLTLAEIYGKSIVRHPAPPFFMLKNPTTLFPTYHVQEAFSYPSGHAARAVFLGLTFYLSFIIYHLSLKRRQKIAAALGIIVYILGVGMSRIYLGQHWLSDVIGGLFLGVSLGIFAGYLIYDPRNKGRNLG